MAERPSPKPGPAAAPRPGSDAALLKRLWPYVRPYRRLLLAALALNLVAVGAALAEPYLLKLGIDEHVAPAAGGDAAALDGLLGLSLLYALLIAGGFAARAVGLYATSIAGLRSLAALRRGVFQHVLAQGQRFFDGRTTGSLMTRTIHDADALYESLVMSAIFIVTDVLTVAGVVVAMLTLDWRLTLASLAVAPPLAWLMDLFRRRLRALHDTIREALSRLNGAFAEYVHGVDVVRLHGVAAEAEARRDFGDHAYRFLDASRRANIWDASLYALMDGMSAVSVGVVLLFAASAYGASAPAAAGEAVPTASALTLGLLVAFVDYLRRLYVPVRELSGRLATLQRGGSALQRIFGLLDAEQRVHGGDAALPAVRGEVTFQDVTFGYGAEAHAVLRGVTFALHPGEVVALVGATGSGKSTVARLLTAAYDGYDGRICLDGHELRGVRVGDVRAAVATVAQDVYLFSTSVFENVRMWDAGISPPRVEEAVTLARADALVAGLPDGLEHTLSDRGKDLSAGERQLLGIARVLCRDAPVVVLDEATASVDPETERLLDEALGAVFARRTVLVIAHRLSTVRRADRVVVLHGGRVVQEGTHAELMERGGRYRLLVEAALQRH